VPRTSVRIVNLQKWFPSDSPLAAKIARTCILREDLLIEMQGVLTEDIEPLDGLSPEFRRIFFLRSLFQTYSELCSGLQTLFGCPDFRALLGKQPDSVKAKFREQAQTIATVHPILKDVRNDVCGHVLNRAVQEALERIPEKPLVFWRLVPLLQKVTINLSVSWLRKPGCFASCQQGIIEKSKKSRESVG
jgi:hypothetical protein